MSRAILATILAVAPAALSAQAGVVVQQKTSFNVAHVSNADLQQTISILGTDKAKTVTTGKVKILIISSNADGTEITRLDQDQVIKVNDKKKEYEIKPLAEVREELAKQQKNAEKSATDAQEKDNMRYYAVVDESKRTGKHETINGFNTDEFSIKITIMAENTKTKQTSPYMHLIADLWVDPSQKEAAKVLAAYAQARAKALGMDPTMASNPYAKWLTNVQGEMAKIEGYPIRSVMTFEAEADSAAMASNQQNKPSNPLGGLGGLLGKKKDPPPAAAGSGSGRPVLFTSTSEVLAISTTPPAASEFEIPAGYKKK